MRTIIVLVTFVVGNLGYLIKVPPTLPPFQPHIAPISRLNNQKLIIPLFENVCEPSNDSTINRLAKEFIIKSTDDNFSNPDVLVNLQKLINKGILGKDEIFTEYNSDHLHEFQVIYELLYYANDFDEFYKASAWSRQNLNCGLYVNAIYMAIQNRTDTQNLSIPAPYELVPNYFVMKDVLLRGVYISLGQNINETEHINVEGNTYTLDANYTSMYYENDDEYKLAYFREDIGLNSYYFLWKLEHAPWTNIHINGSYGEEMYHMMKQLMARYNLERYSNGLPELESLNWNSTLDDTYDPMLIYANGNEFIHRTAPVERPDNEDVTLLQIIENSIETVVSHMRESGHNKTQILNHLMAILATGDRSYETLARRLLGKDLTDNGSPSILEHYMTSLRDPAFWKINNKIVNIIDNALKMLPSYTKSELYFPGVEIINVDVKKMMTVIDPFEFDVTDALKVNENDTFQIKIVQPRLNHKPFIIKIAISSIVSQKGLVKIFLGPKLLPEELITKKNNFMLLDQFDANLKIGSNVITRTSYDMEQYSEDFIDLKTLRKNIQDAEFGLNSLPNKTVKSQTRFPSRLILPKGTPQGLPLQIFVFIAPYTKATIVEFYSILGRDFNTAVLSPDYPLDLTINYPLLFDLPNAKLKDITVTHKESFKGKNYEGPEVTKKWYGSDNYDKSSWHNYSVNKNEPFDYNSNKAYYGNKEDFILKNGEITTLKSIVEDVNELNVPHLKLLRSTAFDWASKKKGSFDYKSNIDQYGKKIKKNENIERDSKEIDKSKDKISIEKENTSASSDIIYENYVTDKKLDYMDKIKEINLVPVAEQTDRVDVEINELKPSIHELIVPKKRYTIYDFIFNNIDVDSSEEKVYEKK